MLFPCHPSRKYVVFSEDIGLWETLEVSEASRNYSLIDDSYWDTSDNSSYSIDDVNLFALKETHNIDFTTEKENRNQKGVKRKQLC